MKEIQGEEVIPGEGNGVRCLGALSQTGGLDFISPPEEEMASDHVQGLSEPLFWDGPGGCGPWVSFQSFWSPRRLPSLRFKWPCELPSRKKWLTLEALSEPPVLFSALRGRSLPPKWPRAPDAGQEAGGHVPEHPVSACPTPLLMKQCYICSTSRRIEVSSDDQSSLCHSSSALPVSDSILLTISNELNARD